GDTGNNASMQIFRGTHYFVGTRVVAAQVLIAQEFLPSTSGRIWQTNDRQWGRVDANGRLRITCCRKSSNQPLRDHRRGLAKSTSIIGKLRHISASSRTDLALAGTDGSKASSGGLLPVSSVSHDADRMTILALHQVADQRLAVSAVR